MESYIYRSIYAARRRILSDICKISIILAQELISTDICWGLIMTDIRKHIWTKCEHIYQPISRDMYIDRYNMVNIDRYMKKIKMKQMRNRSTRASRTRLVGPETDFFWSLINFLYKRFWIMEKTQNVLKLAQALSMMQEMNWG